MNRMIGKQLAMAASRKFARSDDGKTDTYVCHVRASHSDDSDDWQPLPVEPGIARRDSIPSIHSYRYVVEICCLPVTC